MGTLRGYVVITLGRETALSLLMSPFDTKLFELVELYSGDGLEMAGTLGKRPYIDCVQCNESCLNDDNAA